MGKKLSGHSLWSHRAHVLPPQADKTGKAFKYLEAVLSFIECGMATESEGSAKAAYAVYSETIELIR